MFWLIYNVLFAIGFALMLGSGVGAANEQPVAAVYDPPARTGQVAGFAQEVFRRRILGCTKDGVIMR